MRRHSACGWKTAAGYCQRMYFFFMGERSRSSSDCSVVSGAWAIGLSSLGRDLVYVMGSRAEFILVLVIYIQTTSQQ